MDKNRGLMIIGASVALLVSAGALTYWMRKRGSSEEGESEQMVEKYEEYANAEAKPKPKRKPRTTHARNGRVTA